MTEEIEGVRDPPRTFGGIVRMLGPGIIMAGGIVGSGELIAATRTGAEAGFIFLGSLFSVVSSNASRKWRWPGTLSHVMRPRSPC